MNPKELKLAVNERKAAVAAFEQRAAEAERLAAQVASLQKDLARFEERQAGLAALGNDRLELVQRSPYPGLSMVIEWEPLRSRYTGKELAASIQPEVDELRRAISEREAQIAELLSD